MESKIVQQVRKEILETLSYTTLTLQELRLRMQLAKEKYNCVTSRFGGDSVETNLMKFYNLICKSAETACNLTIEILRTLTDDELQQFLEFEEHKGEKGG